MNQSPSSSDSIILKTKLYPPSLTQDMVPRVALLERLEQNRQRPLTLIAAPAGYGKSMLASMWLQASDLPGGWLSLDESDNNLHIFVSYFLAAIETAVPHVALQTSALLSNSVSQSPTALARQLLADLDQLLAPFLLVLDDIQAIHEERIWIFLAALLEHPSPILHLVLVGRQDPPLPIASWRAYGQINEIRARDLRFSSAETAQLLGEILQHDIGMPEAAEWTTKTEGWIVALRLAALALSHPAQVRDLTVDVPGSSQFLHEYLLGEVLDKLPMPQQDWLLKIALLDRFCAPLCAAVCDGLRQDGGGQMDGGQFMEWLRKSNLFLINLDNQNEWFRFHHLFQDDLQQMLKKKLDEKEIAALNRRASQWFAENGWVAEAIRHALAADDHTTASKIFSANRNAAMNGERWHQLEQWIRLFPANVIENDPVLLLTRAHLPLSYGFDYDMEATLTQAGSMLAKLPDDTPDMKQLWAEMAYFSGLVALMMGPAATAISAGAAMYDSLPADAYYLRGQALGLEAVGYQMSGSVEQGIQLFQEALAARNLPANFLSKAYLNQSILYFMEADLATAQFFAEQSIAVASEHGLDTSQASCFAGAITYLRNELTLAETHLVSVAEHSMWVDPVYLAQAVCVLVHVYCAQRRPEKAWTILEQTRSYLKATDNSYAEQLLDMFQIELALDLGDIDRARRLSLTQNIDLQLPIWFWHYYIPHLTPIKLWLAEVREVERALALLEEMDEFLRKMNRTIYRIDILALQALAYKALDNWPKALEKLAQSVKLAAPGGFIRNNLDLGSPLRVLLVQLYERNAFVDKINRPYVARILDAFAIEDSQDGQSTAQVSSSIDPLTEREQEVLKLLATGLSTKEIAAEMNVQWSTIRSHIKNIYSKLGVHGRYEAVLYAGEHNLL